MCMETRNSKTEMPLFKVKDEKFIFAVQMKLQSKCRFVRKDGMRLLDLCDIKYGYAFDSKKFTDNPIYPPLVRIRDVKRGFSETFYAGEYSKEYLLHKGDLLIGMDGEFNIARWKSVDALLNQRVCKISAKKGINEEYIRFALSKKLKNIEDKTSFVTVKHLSARELSAIEFIMPEYEKQRKIADILVSIENIIEKKKQELEQLDTLVKSRFAEMFGDPIQNPYNWSIKSLLEMGYCKNGMNFHTGDSGIELYCLGVGDFKDYSIIDGTDQLSKISLNEMPPEESMLQNGDIVFVRSNGNKDLVGRCVLVYPYDVQTTYSGFCIRYRLTSREVNKNYLLRVLKTDSMRKQMTGRGANIQNLNQKTLATLNIPIPPIELQNQFADFVASIDKSKSKIQKSLEETQLLFDSLMQKYFG